MTGNDIKTPSTELKTPSVTTPFLKARNECYVIRVNVVSVVFEKTELAFNRFKIMYIKKSSKGSKIFSLHKK